MINHEFRQLQLDTKLSGMSVFDLIDHCASLFEELGRSLHKEHGVRLYMRAYLIFNYFINTFIMVHFNGFAKFMELLQQDFIIYLNLYHFFRSEDVMARDAFDVDLAAIRLWVVQYLTSKDLLTFDVGLLYGWLDEYIDYLKHKEEESEVQGDDKGDGASNYYASALRDKYPSAEQLDEDEDDEYDAFDFNTRFPEVPAQEDVPRPVDLKAALLPTVLLLPKAPYPVSESISEREVPKSDPPYPKSNGRLGNLQSLPQPTADSRERPKYVYGSNSHDNSSSRRLGSHLAEYPPAHAHVSNGAHKPPTPHSSHNVYDTQTAFSQNALGRNAFQFEGPQSTPATFMHTHHSNNRAGMSSPNLSSPQHFSQPLYSSQNLYSRPPHKLPSAPNSYSSQGNAQNGPYQNGSHPSYSSALLNNAQGRVDRYYQKSNWMRSHAICGLKNLGSSCYINLTVQVLVGLDIFVNAILSRSRKPDGPLSEAVAGLIATFKANGGANIAPTKFLRVLAALKPDFNIPFEQQDAQEILLFLLDKLHEEMAVKPISESVDYLAKWQISVDPREKEEYLKWYRGLIKNEGELAINDTFQGHVQSKLVCNKCGHRSISYSSFTILSLPIPESHGNPVDLTDCLRYYTQDEVLQGENAWNCPKCNKTSDDAKDNPMDVVFQPKRGMFRFTKRSKSPSKKPAASASPPSTCISIKQLSFIKLPPVLFIHLSRFSLFNLTDKLNTDIVYPLRLKFNHESHDIYYSCTGLINHYGNLKSGHYTALVNKAPSSGDNLYIPAWCYFDDDKVRVNVVHGDASSPDFSKQHSRDVFVLCYERV